MESLSHRIQQYSFGAETLQLSVPVDKEVQQHYEAEKQAGHDPLFPYWAKLWPASIGLCQYLEANKAVLQNKTVLELAAGLGLPSLLAARYAASVICSDYMPAALEFTRRSAVINQVTNMECRCLDWNNFGDIPTTDIVLMSDVNYDPGEFEILFSLLTSLLQNGSLLILSTPQRIMGKSFIERLLPFCREQQTIPVEDGSNFSEIFIMQLKH